MFRIGGAEKLASEARQKILLINIHEGRVFGHFSNKPSSWPSIRVLLVLCHNSMLMTVASTCVIQLSLAHM